MNALYKRSFLIGIGLVILLGTIFTIFQFSGSSIRVNETPSRVVYNKDGTTYIKLIKKDIENFIEDNKTINISLKDFSKALSKKFCREVPDNITIIPDCSFLNLSHLNMSKLDLSDTIFNDATLSHTDFSEANLARANMSFTDLTGASFRKANLYEANFESIRSSIQDTNFEGTIYENALPTKDWYKVSFLK